MIIIPNRINIYLNVKYNPLHLFCFKIAENINKSLIMVIFVIDHY